MEQIKIGKLPTERRRFRHEMLWYGRGNSRPIEKHLACFYHLGLMDVDEELLDKLPQATVIRPHHDNVVRLKKPPRT